MTIHATLRYDDADAAVAFLTGALGLRARNTSRDGDGRASQATLAHEGAHHTRAVAAGAPVVMELVDQPDGSREYAVTDPEGNVWSVGSYRP